MGRGNWLDKIPFGYFVMYTSLLHDIFLQYSQIIILIVLFYVGDSYLQIEIKDQN